MTARELYQAGKLNEAVLALNAELREHPDDVISIVVPEYVVAHW